MSVVGIGPGNPLDRTHRAEAAIARAQVIVGYKPYLDSIADLTAGKKLISSGMRQEVQRVRAALEACSEGGDVALISSGDAGIYGMAGLALELAHAEKLTVPITIIPGLTAASAAAAALGAPLMLDFAVISLSDLLVDWATIRRRIQAVAAADLVLALYNPRSTKRITQLEETVAILRQHRPATTPVGIVTAASTEEQTIVLTDLAHSLEQTITMRSIVLIGNTDTKRLAQYLVTARGYRF